MYLVTIVYENFKFKNYFELKWRRAARICVNSPLHLENVKKPSRNSKFRIFYFHYAAKNSLTDDILFPIYTIYTIPGTTCREEFSRTLPPIPSSRAARPFCGTSRIQLVLQCHLPRSFHIHTGRGNLFFELCNSILNRIFLIWNVFKSVKWNIMINCMLLFFFFFN